MFRVECLGANRVCRSDGSQVHFRSRKHFALLVHLALTGPRAHRRERLVGLLWPEDGDAKARHSLSQALYALRRLFGEEVVEVRGEEVQIGSARPAVDALEFEEHLRRGDLACAVALCRGEFLEGFWIRGARPFEEWMDRERARLAAELRQALRTLIREGRERGEWAAVMERSRRLIQLEPYDEHAYADLMRALWIVGDRAGALKEYEVLREVLASDLDAEPGVEIEELAARIRRRTAEAKRKEGERKVEPSLSEPPFVGRKEEYARLLAIWQRVKEGHAAGVVLTGEPGIGKTRLAEEFLKYVATEEALVLRGACYPFLQGMPYAPFADAFRSNVIPETLEGLEPRWQLQLARVFPELTGSASSADTGNDCPPEGSTRLQFESIAQLFCALARKQSTVVFIDNLQWADSGSSDLGYFVLQRLPDLPIMLVATSRDEQTHNWVRWPLESETKVTVIRIPPLSRSEMDGLVKAVSPRACVEQVYILCQGNAFFALELCRGRTLGGETAAETNVGPDGVNLAQSRDAKTVVQTRLSFLDSTARRLLEAASVIGEPVSIPFLESTSGLEKPSLLAAVDGLAQAGFITCSGDLLGFTHDLVSEAVYEALPEVRRRILHARVASVLDADGESSDAVKRAWHYDQAGDRTRAFAISISAATVAAERYAYDQAHSLARLAVKNASGSEERLRATFLLGQALVHQRRYSAARPVLRESEVLASELENWELRIRILNLLWGTELDSSERPLTDLVRSGESILNEPWFQDVSRRTRMDFAVLLLATAYRAGDLAGMRRAVDLAETLGEGSVDWYLISRMLRVRAVFEGMLGRCEAAMPLLERRVHLAEEQGSLAEELDAVIDTAFVLTIGFVDLETCRRWYTRALKLSDRLGDPLMRGRCHNNWGSTLMDWGRFPEAESHFLKAIEVLTPYAELTEERAAVEANLGELYWLQSRQEEAEVRWRRANALARPGHHIMWLVTTAGLGLCAIGKGDDRTAREYCAEAFRSLRRYRSLRKYSGLSTDVQDPYLLSAWLSLRRGRGDKAIRVLKSAAMALQEREPASYVKLLLGGVRLLRDRYPLAAISLAEELVDFAGDRNLSWFHAEGVKLLRLLVGTHRGGTTGDT